MSHAPQWSASVAVVTHAPPQAVCDAGHWSWHLPVAHTSPRAQAFEHIPQFATSVFVSTQRSPQRVVPDGHAHAPALHT